MNSFTVRYKLFALLLSVNFILAKASAQTVTLKQIGKDNLLFNKHDVEYYNGFLYSIDNTGALYKTELRTGDHARLGNVTYKNTKFFFGINNKLFSIETDGSMYRIDLVTGAWSVVAGLGTWTNIMKAFVVANTFYAIEEGALYLYSALNPKARKQIGKAEFYNVGTLIRGDSTLYSMMGDGTLYEINTSNGDWKKIAKSKGWKNIRSGEVLNGKFYAVETPGILTETTLVDGTRKELDTTQFSKASLLVADAGKLYTVTTEGTLYEINMN